MLCLLLGYMSVPPASRFVEHSDAGRLHGSVADRPYALRNNVRHRHGQQVPNAQSSARRPSVFVINTHPEDAQSRKARERYRIEGPADFRKRAIRLGIGDRATPKI